MRMKIRRIVRTQGGYILALVLVVLVLGGLLLAPLLGLMGTGLISGRIYERNIDGLYAADAGVEHAMWKIENRDEDVSGLTQCNQSWTGNITDVNGKWVDVEIELVRLEGDVPFDYRIVSRATGDDSETAIEAYVAGTAQYSDFSGLLDHLITINRSLDDNEIERLEKDLRAVTLAYKDECYTDCGDDCFIADNCVPVWDYNDIPEGCEGCGAVYNYPDELWPSEAVLREFYKEDVEGLESYASNDLYVGPVTEIGPLYRDGPLNIRNAGNSPVTLTLTGTLYIEGDTTISGSTSSDPSDLTIDLNGHTIFVDSTTMGNKNALLVEKCSIVGPGSVIAVGDVEFAPKGDVGNNEEPVFILSTSGTTELFPSGNFYGAVAGDFYVEVKLGSKPTLTYPPGGMGDDFNFPGMGKNPRLDFGIQSWTIIRPDEE